MRYSQTYNRLLMWEIDSERLRDALVQSGLTQSELADRVGLKQPSIGRLLTGETKTTRVLDLIASALDISPAYLRGETDDPTPMANGAAAARKLRARDGDGGDAVELSELDLAYGMGSTFIDDLPVKAEPRTFSRAWLRNFTDSPTSNLFFARGLGDSMAPTIMSEDILLIDTAQQTPRMADQIWAVAMHGMGMIKRLRPSKDGGMRLMSDNQNVREDVAYHEELFVIGRVVAVVRKT
ncbi:helix-turn-helix domain-containing protein [Sphingomonas psychrotolerans]|uniref:Helix-turn-helix domain-containing protein n=1 Tax=Sphingomonas psychrotolerans TaxID=1327635 RepID=A0ABU3N4K9_9SPHN|nr:S24 family peptidase [Sphingomonas psychrotolerans]MDT8758255.1 helix-turn-helix domain-containing protein [Sphingomonas psychrotolerans]